VRSLRVGYFSRQKLGRELFCWLQLNRRQVSRYGYDKSKYIDDSCLVEHRIFDKDLIVMVNRSFLNLDFLDSLVSICPKGEPGRISIVFVFVFN
jgi:hypothetical protein